MKNGLVEVSGLLKNEKTRNVIVIFTKVPNPGLAKTRLSQISVLTSSDASKIAEAMLKDVMVLSSESNIPICLGFYPSQRKKTLQSLVNSIQENLNSSDFHYLSQNGDNFDERFESIITQVIDAGFNNIIIIGADLPYLHPRLIDRAISKLSEPIDAQKVIIGPANGGGIYLVGLTQSFKPNWITDYKLFTEGIEILKFVNLCEEKKLELVLLPPLNDVDIEEDLVSLITYLEALLHSGESKYFHFPKYTNEIIKELKLKIKESDGTRARKIIKGD